MSSTAPIKFEDVVVAFNQCGYPDRFLGGKLDPKSANFKNVKLELAEVIWNNAQAGVKDLAPEKQVQVVDQPRSSVTTVTAYTVPGSSVNIVSGFMTGSGINSKVAQSTIKLPKLFGDVDMNLDLTKTQQMVILPKCHFKSVEIQGSGAATVKSKSTVFQGTFQAEARFTGYVTFRTQDRSGTEEVSIAEMAEKAQKARTLKKPFSYSGNSLSWIVSGNMDLVVEDVTFISK